MYIEPHEAGGQGRKKDGHLAAATADLREVREVTKSRGGAAGAVPAARTDPGQER
jgi:hypothetical protein